MKITKKLLEELIKEELSALLEGEGKIVCPNCGHHNESGVDKCSKCGHPRNKGSWKAAKEEQLDENPAIPAMALADKFLVEPNKKVDKFTSKSASPMAREALRQVSALKKRVAALESLVKSMSTRRQ